MHIMCLIPIFILHCNYFNYFHHVYLSSLSLVYLQEENEKLKKAMEGGGMIIQQEGMSPEGTILLGPLT